MGYVIKKVPYIKGPGWKVQREDRSNGQRSAKDVPRDQLKALGFDVSMSIDEARKVRDYLNTKDEERRHAERRAAIETRLTKEDAIESVYLLKADAEEFQRKYLFAREHATKKVESHWRAVKCLVRTLEIPPEDWFEMRHMVYDYLSKKQYSPSYVRKLFQVLNLWGHFISRKRKTSFLPVPPARGREAQRIADAYFDKNEDGLVSAPLTPSQLDKARSSFAPEQYNWLYMTVWFGLRPEETDHLHDPKRTLIEERGNEIVLRVYQSKLRSVARSKRWKEIPCKRPEQLIGVSMIREGAKFKRPLNKTVQKHISLDITCYGGRKNFTDMFLGFGYALEDVSMWMGHATIERTWRSYKQKQKTAA